MADRLLELALEALEARKAAIEAEIKRCARLYQG